MGSNSVFLLVVVGLLLHSPDEKKYLKLRKKDKFKHALGFRFKNNACEWNMACVFLILCFFSPNCEFDLKCNLYISKNRHGIMIIFLPWVNFSLLYDILWTM